MPKLSDSEIIKRASVILERKAKYEVVVNSPKDVHAFLQTKFYGKEREIFSVMFLNSQNQLIEYKEMFKGTISSASVHPREVAKKALQLNAAAIVMSHNHPSGDPTPSMADRRITDKLVKCLSMFDVSVLDHIIIGKGETASFAERGLI